MTPKRFNEIEALARDLFEEAQLDIENTRAIYNGLRDALMALAPHVGPHPPWCDTVCSLPPIHD